MGLLGYVPSFIYRSDGYVHCRALEDQLAELDRKADRLRDGNRLLAAQIERLRRDPATLEAVARDELGLVKPGEIVIQIERP